VVTQTLELPTNEDTVTAKAARSTCLTIIDSIFTDSYST
jgi:hypothetical protein